MQTDYCKETGTNEKLRLFSLCADFEASGRAQWVASTITKLAGERWRCSSEMLKLDSLTSSEPISNIVTNNAADADVLIVAVSSLEQRALDLIHWLGFLATWEPNRSVPGLLIGLLGDEKNESQELSWTVKELIRCAQKTNRDFMWHWMGENATADSDWLTENVEMLLARKQSLHEEFFLQGTTVGVG